MQDAQKQKTKLKVQDILDYYGPRGIQESEVPVEFEIECTPRTAKQVFQDKKKYGIFYSFYFVLKNFVLSADDLCEVSVKIGKEELIPREEELIPSIYLSINSIQQPIMIPLAYIHAIKKTTAEKEKKKSEEKKENEMQLLLSNSEVLKKAIFQ